MTKKILVVLSEYGYWGEELVGPIEAFDQAGYESVFATPTGKRPPVLPPSMDSTYIDPPLGRTVVSKEMVEKVKAFESTDRLDVPLGVQDMFSERPYASSEHYERKMEVYYQSLEKIQQELASYDALLLVGGSGPLIDMVNNQRVHDLVLTFHRMGKLIAAECYSVTCLAFARDIREKRSLIWGKRVTGHPIEYDYHDGTGVIGIDFNFGPPFFPLEYILRDAVGPDGEYIGNVGNKTSVIVDYPFITSRSTASSYLCGEKVVECLEQGLQRFGW